MFFRVCGGIENLESIKFAEISIGMKNLTAHEIDEQLLQYIRQSVVERHVPVDSDTSFTTVGIDSMGIIELVLFIERKFNIAIPEQEMIPANFKSVRTLAECAIRNKK
jgi:acyl carrier protein